MLTNNLYENIVKNMNNGLFIIDKTDNIIFCNDSFKKMVGYDTSFKKSSDIFNKSILHYINNDDIIIENKIINDNINKDILININSSIDNNIVCLCTDITNIKNFSEKIRIAFLESNEVKDKYEKSDKLKSLFLSSVSHELRTPLNSIIGFSNLLIMDNKSKSDKKKYTDIIKKNSDQLLNLINDIIDISKIESNEIDIRNNKCSLVDIITNVYNTNNIKLNNRNIKLIIENKPNIIIYSDEYRITQILNNLISNAIKFTDNGYVKIGYNINNHDIDFYIEDTGIGIKDENIEYIFDTFKQIDEQHTKKYKGTGLGLSITKKLVELLGGKIWVNSTFNKGTTFHFSLPSDYVQKIVNEYDIINKYMKKTIDWSNKTILISNDNNHINNILIEIIKKSNGGYKIVKDGLSVIKEINNNNYDLIITDIKLSDIHSYDLIKKIKKIPVIIKLPTSMLNKEILYRLNFSDYIISPINISEVIKKIDNIFNKS